MTSQPEDFLFNADFRRKLPLDGLLRSYEIVDGGLVRHDDWYWQVQEPTIAVKTKNPIF